MWKQGLLTGYGLTNSLNGLPGGTRTGRRRRGRTLICQARALHYRRRLRNESIRNSTRAHLYSHPAAHPQVMGFFYFPPSTPFTPFIVLTQGGKSLGTMMDVGLLRLPLRACN